MERWPLGADVSARFGGGEVGDRQLNFV
jgi:hypothetical protein